MRDRKLTGPWAGFAFKGGRLVTPEGRELEPQDLAWLSLTAALAQEWRSLMAELGRGDAKSRSAEKSCGTRRSAKRIPAGRVAEVVTIKDIMVRRQRRSSALMAGPGADPAGGAQPVPAQKPRRRV